jgi:non-ribosomal peptide synthetase component F
VSVGPGSSATDVLVQVIDALRAHAARVDHVPQADLGTRRFTAGYQHIALPAGPLPASNTRGVSFRGVPTLSLPELAELADPPGEQPMPARTQRSPGDLAYVMYTSGSTGEPKGVAVTHSGLVNYLRWAASTYLATRDDSFVHTSVAFDLTITSLLAPLAAGGCVHISQSAGLRELAEAATAPADRGVLKVTPAHLRLLAGLLPPERAATLARCFVIGGEALTDSALAYWRQHASQAVLICLVAV